MNLSDVFTKVVHKQLVAVDLLHKGSNQHEINGSKGLRAFFGTAGKVQGGLGWYYFCDDEETAQGKNEFSFYDARAKSTKRTGRTEWRLYYYGSFISHAEVGDWLFLAEAKSGQIFALIFQKDSAWLRAAKVLFGVDKSEPAFNLVKQKVLDSKQLELLQQQIISELGLGLDLPVAPNDEALILSKFGKVFPTTKIMAEFAREQTEVDINNPDEALVRWLAREESLFRALENVLISERLKKGFADVDDFINFSLSAQNRRKSRMGFALQNHLAEIFVRHNLHFTPQAVTEASNRPDFIFPGQKEYHDVTFDPALLIMLGVKSSSKDRWRQVLTEADRIPRKHLCTLEAGISTKQTDEMVRQHLTLVIPASLQPTYTAEQRRVLLSVGTFVEFVRTKQKKKV